MVKSSWEELEDSKNKNFLRESRSIFWGSKESGEHHDYTIQASPLSKCDIMVTNLTFLTPCGVAPAKKFEFLSSPSPTPFQ